MRFNVIKFIKYYLILLILINLSLFKIFPNSIKIFYDQYFISLFNTFSALCLASICVCLPQISKIIRPYVKYVNVFIVFLLLMLSIEGIYTCIIYNYDIKNVFISLQRFLVVLFIYPIITVVVFERFKFIPLIKFVVWFTVISYLIRIGISFYEGLTGVILNENIALEYAAKNWYRDGVLRINPPIFGWVFIPLSIFLLFESKKLRGKMIYLAISALAVFYTINIHNARSIMIYQLIVIFLMIMFVKKNSMKKIVFWSLLFLFIVIAVNSPAVIVVDNFFGSFSARNAETGSSTEARLNTVSYLYSLYSRSPFMGIGLLQDSDLEIPGGGHITDIGLLANIFRFGFWGIIMYILLIGRWIYISFFALKDGNHSKSSILAMGITISLLLLGINIDIFHNMCLFATPFYWAILELIFYNRKRWK